MNRKQIVAAVGGSLGTAAIASGAFIGLNSAHATGTTTASGSTASTTSASAPGMAAHRHGPGHGPGFMRMRGEFGPGLAKDLAAKLGKTPDQVRAAMKQFREANKPPAHKPGTPRMAPAQRQAQRQAMETKLAASLAKSLDVSQSQVQTALAQVKAQFQAKRTEAFTKHLNAAVAQHKITKADEASILKAFHAGVLGPR